MTPPEGVSVRRAAILVDDRERFACAIDLAQALAAAGVLVTIVGNVRRTRTRGARRLVRVPPFVLDGSFNGRRFMSALFGALDRARPQLVVGIGERAGAAGGVAWATSGARRYCWFQPAPRQVDLDSRACAIAAAWTPDACAADRAGAEFLARRFGWSAPVLDPARLAARLLAPLPGSAGVCFDRRLILRALFTRVFECDAQIAELTAHLRRARASSVAIVGEGDIADAVAARCRRAGIRVKGLVPPHENFARSVALRARPAAVVATTRGGASNLARRVARAARSLRIRPSVLAIGQPGLVVSARRNGLGLTRRRRRQIAQRVRPIVRALARDRVAAFHIYGSADVGRVLLSEARRAGLRVSFFVDGNPSKWGDVVDRVEVVPLPRAAATGIHVYAIGSLASADAVASAIEHGYRSPEGGDRSAGLRIYRV